MAKFEWVNIRPKLMELVDCSMPTLRGMIKELDDYNNPASYYASWSKGELVATLIEHYYDWD